MNREEQESVDGNLEEVRRYLSSSDGNPDVQILHIKFQVGPIKEVGVNGCQIEDVIDVLVERLEAFQRGPLKCAENKMALNMLLGAKGWLHERTVLRQAQGVEGTAMRHES